MSEYALIVDEAHHTPASTFAGAVELSRARRRLGLSATPARPDGMRLDLWLGDVVFEWARPQRAAFRQPEAPSVAGARGTAVERTTALARDPDRTRWLAARVEEAARDGRRTLVLAQRVELLEALAELLGGRAEVVSGRTPAAARERALGQAEIVLASMQIAKEGLDTDCTALVYATPPGGDLDGLVTQTVGRVTRTPREALIVDPVDAAHPLPRQAERRADRWRAEGFRELPEEHGC